MFPIVMICLFVQLIQAQNKWVMDNLSNSKITEQSYEFVNNSNNTLVIEIVTKGEEPLRSLIYPKSKKSFVRAITYHMQDKTGKYSEEQRPVKLKKDFYENTHFNVYYTDQCYYVDENYLLKEMRDRQIANNFNRLFYAKGRVGLKWLADKDTTWVGKTIKFGEKVYDGYNFYKDANKNGLVNASLERLMKAAKKKSVKVMKDKAKVQLEELGISRDFLDTADDMYKYGSIFLNHFKSYPGADVSDILNQLEYLVNQISNEPLFTFTLDYDSQIKPYVDRDGDGIYNSQDKCPDIAGPDYLLGCDIKYWEEVRKAQKGAKRAKKIEFLGTYGFDMGYISMNISNDRFQYLIDNDILKELNGFQMSFTYTKYPFWISASMGGSERYKLEDPNNVLFDGEFMWLNIDGVIKFDPTYSFNHSRFLIPRIGLGVSNNYFCANCDLNDEVYTWIVAPIATAGLMIPVHRYVHLQGEYVRTFLNGPKSFDQINVGLGMRF